MAIGSPRAIIHLGHRLLGGSSDLPECWHHEPDAALKIERLTLLDLAPDGVCRGEQSPVPWWALTPPFHPYRNLAALAVSFCCTFPGLTTGRRYRPSCSLEPGLSSPRGPFREETVRGAIAQPPDIGIIPQCVRGAEELVLADTRSALIVLVLSAAVLVIVIEHFACMASTRLALRPINRRSPTRGSCPLSPSAYPLPNSRPSSALTRME